MSLRWMSRFIHIILSVIMLSFIILRVIILSVIMLNVALYILLCWMSRFICYFYAECHYEECWCAECHYAACYCAECHYADCRGAIFHVYGWYERTSWHHFLDKSFAKKKKFKIQKNWQFIQKIYQPKIFFFVVTKLGLKNEISECQSELVPRHSA